MSSLLLLLDDLESAGDTIGMAKQPALVLTTDSRRGICDIRAAAVGGAEFGTVGAACLRGGLTARMDMDGSLTTTGPNAHSCLTFASGVLLGP